MGRNIIKRRDVAWSFLMLAIISAPLVIAHAYARSGAQNANLIRDTQLLLTLNGFYRGPINGECSEVTQLAINKYEATFESTPPGASCSTELLEKGEGKMGSLIDELTLCQ